MKRAFVIQFENLGLGKHDYEFRIDSELFSKHENETILGADIAATVELTKSSNMMDINVKFGGELTVPCDRCNEPMELRVNESGRLIVKFGQSEHQDLDDLIILEEHEHEIDLSQFFYENICLMVPARNVHTESKCDPEIIAFLAKAESERENNEGDPRWEKLKNIKN